VIKNGIITRSRMYINKKGVIFPKDYTFFS